jgi:hypothetical protein
LFTLSGQSLGSVANGEIVAVEIVSTLVGSIGLVAAVPISTWIAALVADDHGDGREAVRRPPRSRRSRHRAALPPEQDLLAPRDEAEFWR